MAAVKVELKERSYTVHISHKCLDKVGSLARTTCAGEIVCTITNTDIAPLYLDEVERSLQAAGYRTCSIILPPGEDQKSMEVLASVLEKLAELGLSRKDLIVALGGGVIGDLAGFAAASYLRGINFCQVPTSLLAMVDSSVGGKVAVDLKAGKNMAGAFWQPKFVLVDTAVLESIPQDLFRDSVGEVIKYGVMNTPSLFEVLEAEPLTQALDTPKLQEIIRQCIQIKADIVSQDEKESGLRQFLNLGHTFGHAIEAQSHFEMAHGACVALGTYLMARAAHVAGELSSSSFERITKLIEVHQLPTACPYSYEELTPWLTSDKKRAGSTYTIVSIQDIGSCSLKKVSEQELKHILLSALS